MRALAFVLALFGFIAAAGPLDATRGGNLKRRQYQTSANISYYVDGTLGSDSNACTSSGTGACATFTAAIGKVPYRIAHTVTINVAAGTYTAAMQIVGFNIARPSGNLSASAALNITGTQIAPTLTGGTTSGTLTAVAAASGPTLQLLTDSGQSWVVDELIGRNIQMTSGGANTRYFTIAHNTATTLSIVANTSSTSIAAGNTYNLMTPGAIFTGGTRFQSNSGGTITVTDIAFSSTATVSAMSLLQNASSITLTRVRAAAGGTGAAISSTLPITMSTMTITGGFYQGGTGVCGTQFLNIGSLSILGAEFRNAAVGNFGAICISNNVQFSTLGMYAEADASSIGGVLTLFNANTSGNIVSGVVLRCLTASTGNGFYVTAATGATGLGSTGSWGLSSMSVASCNVGISNNSKVGISFSNGAATFDSVATTGILVSEGGTVNFRGNTPTYVTPPTNELMVDTVAYTWAFFNALPAPKQITGWTGAMIFSQ